MALLGRVLMLTRKLTRPLGHHSSVPTAGQTVHAHSLAKTGARAAAEKETTGYIIVCSSQLLTVRAVKLTR